MPEPVLVLDDVHKAERAGVDADREQGDGKRHLVGDELGAGAEGAEEPPLVALGEPAEHHAVGAERAHRHDVEEPDVEVGDQPAGRHRDRHHQEEGAHEDDRRGQPEDQPVHATGREVLLAEELERVEDGLEDPGGAVVHGADPLLDLAQVLPEDDDQDERHHRRQEEGEHRLDDGVGGKAEGAFEPAVVAEDGGHHPVGEDDHDPERGEEEGVGNSLKPGPWPGRVVTY